VPTSSPDGTLYGGRSTLSMDREFTPNPITAPVGQFARGFISGFQEDPLIGLASRATGFMSEQDQFDFHREAESTLPGQVGAFVGRWAPSMAATLGLYSAGRALVMEGATKLALGQVGKETATAIASGAAEPVGGFFAKQMAGTAAKAIDMGIVGDPAIAAAAKGFLPKPVLLRAAELIGGNASAGLYVGAQELARNGDLGTAAKAWGVATAIGGGFEGSTVLLGKALGATLASSRRAIDVFKNDPEMTSLRANYLAGLENQASKLGTGAGFRGGRTIADAAREMGVDDTTSILETAAATGRGATVPKLPTQAPAPRSFGAAVQAARAAKVTGAAEVEGEEAVKSIYSSVVGSRPTFEMVEGRVGRATRAKPEAQGVSPRPPKVGGPPAPTEGVDPQLLELAGLATQARAVEDFFGSEAGTALMRKPMGTSARETTREAIMLNLFKSPETTFKDLGAAGVKIGQKATEAELNTSIAQGQVARQLTSTHGTPGILQRAAAVTGNKPHDGRFLVPHVDAYIKGGIDAVTPGLRPVFEDIEAMLTDVDGRAIAKGIRGHVTRDQAAAMGNRGIFPIVPDFNKAGKGLETLREKLIPVLQSKRGLTSAEAEDLATRIVDRTRTDPTTLYKEVGANYKELIDAGVPIVEDPLRAIHQFAMSRERKIATSSFLGPNNELRGMYIDMVRRSGGNASAVEGLLSAVIGDGRDVFDQGMANYHQAILNYNMATKLTLSPIANFFQPLGSVLINGIRNTVKGGVKALMGGNHTEMALMEGTGLAQSLMQQASEGFLDPFSASPGAAFVKRELGMNGFLLSERINRSITGLASRMTLIDDVSRAAAGRLRGNNLDAARLRIGQFGMDLGELVTKVQNGEGTAIEEKIANWVNSTEGKRDQMRAMFNGTRLAQAIPSQLRKPLLWQTPMGRVVTQFKTFALNQAKLIRDGVLQQAVAGNMKPAAYFMSFYPAAGELVADLKRGFGGRERPDNRAERLLDNMLALGGLGLISDWFMSVYQRRTLEGIVGPTISEFAQFGPNVMHGIVNGKWDPLVKEVGRLPIVRTARTLGGWGLVTAEEMSSWVHRHSDSGPKEGPGDYPTLTPRRGTP
jgi:hypothetical protein